MYSGRNRSAMLAKTAFAAMLIGVAMAGTALAVDYFDDLESYSVGTSLHLVNGWEGWYGDAGSAAPVTDAQAFSGTRSVGISGGDDQVNVFTGTAQTAGVWEFSTMIYVPSTSTSGSSWLGIESDYNWGGPTTTALSTYFDLGPGLIRGTNVSLLRDQWAEFSVIVDLDRGSYASS